MAKAPVGRLEKIEDLKDFWNSDTQDFTPWLSINIELLGQVLGANLKVVSKSKEVIKGYRPDLVCKERKTGRMVLVENQLEGSDEQHLGRMVMYAAGLKASKVVWIAEKFRSEHKVALNWLNAISDGSVGFYGIEIELFKIGDSPAAPQFKMVCKPGDVPKVSTVAPKEMTHVRPQEPEKEKAEEREEEEEIDLEGLSASKRTQYEFWRSFRDYMKQNSFVKCSKPKPRAYMHHPIGHKGMFLASIASSYNSEDETYTGEVRVELNITNKDARKYYALLERQNEEIEHDMGEPLLWYIYPDTLRCKIYLRKSENIFEDKDWEPHFAWLREKLEKMHKAFNPRIAALDLEDYGKKIG